MTALARRKVLPRHPGIYFRPKPDGKGGIRKPEPPYEISYYDSKGKRTFRVIPGDLADAQQAQRGVGTMKADGKTVLNTRVTVDEAIRHWIGRCKRNGHEVRSIESYEWAKEHISPVLGRVKLRDLKRAHIINLIDVLQDKGLGGASIGRVRAVLSAACNEAMEQGWIGSNPTKVNRAWPSTKSTRDVKDCILTPEEIQRVLAAAPTLKWRALLTVAIYTGMRQSELRGLVWGDVRGDHLHVHQQASRSGEVIPHLKSKPVGFSRQVVIGPEVQAALKEWRAKENPLPTRLVFPNGEGGALAHTSVVKGFKAALRKAKVKELRFHDLRHTAASLLIAGGCDSRTVMQQLGWSNPEQMENYTHLWDPERTRNRVLEAQARAMRS